ncbi:type III secretion system chaperone family protein [Desertihabitans aurantiacus]|uniref:YbjN domain-containing protein n=1 Tax=Desertihabitans aurantiacus TaxID=2282477 RepID=UPI001E5B3124|nr:YbjN domain-containing protein [Desertihabitans aurantiacus]
MRERVIALVRRHLEGSGLRWAETSPGTFGVTLPGEHKLSTECALVVADHTLQVRAFVARRPDEHADEVHRWLLQRNLSGYGVAFSLDSHGDVHLTGRLSLEVVTAAELDRLLGEVARVADESFDTIVGTGFRTAIEREWRWRLARGEPTTNLAAFEHLRPAD